MRREELLDLRERLLSIAAAYGDRPALWVEGESYTYVQLFDRALWLAEVLSRHEETFCVLYCRKNLTRYVSILACVLARKVFVPVNPSTPIAYSERIARQVGSAIYILDSGDVERERLLLEGLEFRPPVLRSVERRWREENGDALPRDRAPAERFSSPMRETTAHAGDRVGIDDQAERSGVYLMFTSGSTGVPKAVLVSRRNLEAYLDGATQLFRPTPEDRFAQINDYTFDLSMHDIFLAWSCGAAVHALPDTVPFHLPSLIREHQITFWLSVPTTGQSIANLGLLCPESLQSLRCSLFCGEPLPQRLARAWHGAANQSTLFNIYGPTECTIAVTAFEWSPELQLPDVVPIGYTYPGQDSCVVDELLRPVAADQPGELFIRGSQVVHGYYQCPEQTEARFVRLPDRAGTWYRTGDWVQPDHRWGLLFRGRGDDQLQVRGYRVERLEVEILMRRALSIDSLAVVGWPVGEANLVEGLVAFIGDTRFTAQEVRQRLCHELPEYMWPRQVHIQQLPYTRSRKVDYAALKRQLSEQTASVVD